MQIPAITPERKIIAFAFLLWTIAVWFASARYSTPVAVPQIAHAQQDLGHGNVLAQKVVEPVQPATVIPKGDKAQASAHIVVPASKPVWVENSNIPGSSPSSSLAGSPAPAADSAPPDCAGYISHLQCPAITLDETLVKDKAGQEDLIVSDQSGAVQATFNPGSLSVVSKAHPWALGVAMPLGLPGASSWGLSGAYQFQALPITVGLSGFTVDGRLAGVATVMGRF